MMRKISKDEQEIIDRVKKEINRLLMDICYKNNMEYIFFKDSKVIQDSIGEIAERMGRLKVTTKKRMTDEEFKELREFGNKVRSEGSQDEK